MTDDEKFEKLIENHHGAAFVTDINGKVVARTKGALPILNSSSDTTIWTNLRPAIRTSAVAGAVQTSGGRLLVDGNEQTFEMTLVPQGEDHVLVLARETGAERNLQVALIDSRQRYKDLVDVFSDFAWEVNEDARFTFVSPRGALGLAPNELIGRRASELEPKIIADLPEGELDRVFTNTEQVIDFEFWITGIGGIDHCVQLSSLPIIGVDGAFEGARGVCREVTAERQRDAALAQAYNRERLLNRIISAMGEELEPVAIMSAAAAATALALGAEGCHIYRLGGTKGQPDGSEGEMELVASYGKRRTQEEDIIVSGVIANPVQVRWNDADAAHIVSPTFHRGAINGAVSMWRDTTRGEWSREDQQLTEDVVSHLGVANEQLANHERVVRLSRTDWLTGLLNRRAFFDEEIPRRFERVCRSSLSSALVYVDLDNFKQTNDTHGHLTGDKVLVQLAAILERLSRPDDALARLGGDEFAIWMTDIDQPTAETRAGDILAASQELAQYSADDEHPLGLSLGIAIYRPGNEESLDDLLTRADMAMYKSKKGGKGRYTVAPEPTNR